MSRQSLTASRLRLILSIGLLLLIAAGVGGFIYLRGLLVIKADEAASVAAKAASSTSRLQALQNAKTTLDNNASIVEKANSMVASSHNYGYQDQIISDLRSIATQAGVQISATDFASVSGATAAPQPGQTATPVIVLPGGVKQIKLTVTLKGPVRYDHLVAFLHYVEQNTLKMEIQKVSITNTNTPSGGYSMVNVDALTLGVYIK